MESVEASTAINDSAPVETNDDALAAIWDRNERDNGSDRDDNGRFASAKPDPESSLEGEEGPASSAEAETSTPAAVEVPVPSNWRGLEDTWSKIPAELRESIKAHEDKLHQTLSSQGQQLSAYKPIGDVVQKYGEYFDGRAGAYKPAEAIDYLFSLQRNMDAKPVETIMQVIDRYGIRDALAPILAGNGQQSGGDGALLAKISQLESTIRGMSDPNRIDQRISEKLREEREYSTVEEVVSRTSKDLPLFSEIEQNDLVYFIEKSWAKLGDTASQDAVLKAAYDMAINADPDLRAKSAALKTSAAPSDPEKIAAAKRSNSTNIKSTSTGRGRDLSEDELLAQVWDKNQRG